MNSKHPFLISTATELDAAQIAHFQVQMADETEKLKLDEQVVLSGVKKVIDQSQPGEYLVAKNNQEIIACLLLLPEWSDWRCKKILWIHSLYVLPKYRRNGIFKALFRFIQNKIESDPEVAGVRLYVDKRNTKAIETYSKLGMNGEHYQVFELMKEF